MKRLRPHHPVPLAVTIFAVFLGACATLSEDACRSGDWFSIGAADGAKGRLPGFLSNHAEACAEYGITPDRAEWEAGRQQGLRTYCTPATVYAEATRGRQLSPVCPAEDLDLLTRAHETGRQYWRIEQRIDRLKGDLRDIRRAVHDLDAEDASLRGRLFLEELRIKNRIRMLEAEQRRYDRPPSA
ncbi:MAG: DUF2799 domain-containing protein [Paracoccaceae bacterium]|nr:DUF2799 domain-containing protein [Paracoccaceae bacterium]